MSLSPRALLWLRLVVLALVLALLALARRLDLVGSLEDPQALADRLVQSGAWGYLAFVGTYMLLKPLGVPGTLFVVAASLIWPWVTAFVVSMIGTMGATVIGFSFARFIARDWVSARIPARLRSFDEALERHAFQTVVLLRLIFMMPQSLQFFFGVSRVGFWTHFWGSLVGYVPPLLLLSYLGSALVDETGRLQPGALPYLAGFAVAAGVVLIIARRLLAARITSKRGPEA